MAIVQDGLLSKQSMHFMRASAIHRRITLSSTQACSAHSRGGRGRGGGGGGGGGGRGGGRRRRNDDDEEDEEDEGEDLLENAHKDIKPLPRWTPTDARALMIVTMEPWMPTNAPLQNGYWKSGIGNGGSWHAVEVGHGDFMVLSRSK